MSNLSPEKAQRLVQAWQLSEGPFSVWDVKTIPSCYYSFLRYPLRPLMLLLASGKLSHWFDWIDLPENMHLDGPLIPGNPHAFNVDSRFYFINRLKEIRMSLGGWKDAFVMWPYASNEEKLKKILAEGFCYAYEEIGGNRLQSKAVCSVISHGPIVALRGRNDCRVSLVKPGKESGPYEELKTEVIENFYHRADITLL